MDQVLNVTFPGGKRVTTEYKGFTIPTDQPLHVGGENSAPAPFDLFLASIATCAGIYVVSFCQKRGIPTEKATIEMSMVRNSETRMIDTIKIKLNLPPEFPEKYIKAVEKAVDQCAVKRHLHAPPRFEIVSRIGSE